MSGRLAGPLLALALLSSEARGDEIVVRAERPLVPRPSRSQTAAGSVVDEGQLSAPGLEAQDVLRGQPGVIVQETGGPGSLATAQVRGATSSQTPVYLGGIRLNDDVAGTADLSTVPLYMVERVEIYRGNAPLLADRLGIGGAIFFEPRRPKKPEVRALVGVGSFGHRTARLGGTVGDDDLAASLGVSLMSADNDYAYSDDRGTRFSSADDAVARRQNADVNVVDVFATARASLSRGAKARLVAQHARREQGVPGLALVPTRSSRARLSRTLLAVETSHRSDDGSRELSLSTAAISSASRFDDPLRELALGATSLDTAGARVEQAASLRVDVTDALSVTPVVRASAERISRAADGTSSGAHRAFSRAGASSSLALGDSISVHALGVAECNGTAPHAPSLCDLALPSGSVGAAYTGEHLSLLANAGRYARAPHLGELFGVSATVRGNDALSPETGLVADLGARAAARLGRARFGLDVFVFAQRIDELIAYRRSSLGYVRPYNVGSSRTLGLELLAAVSPAPPLRLDVALTLLDPRDTSPDRPTTNDVLPFRSRLVVAPGAELTTPPLSGPALGRLRLDARYTHQSSRFADAAGLVIIPAQGDLSSSLAQGFASEHVTVRVRGHNLLGQQRFDLVGYPLPGRSLFGSVEVVWP